MASCLSDIKDKLTKEGVKVIGFNGYQLDTEFGVFTMGPETLYLGKEIISDKDLAKLISDFKEAE